MVPSFVPSKFPVSTIDSDGVSFAGSPEAYNADLNERPTPVAMMFERLWSGLTRRIPTT
jgi:hypothetical protein